MLTYIRICMQFALPALQWHLENISCACLWNTVLVWKSGAASPELQSPSAELCLSDLLKGHPQWLRLRYSTIVGRRILSPDLEFFSRHLCLISRVMFHLQEQKKKYVASSSFTKDIL